jgi:hypothetical protein
VFPPGVLELSVKFLCEECGSRLRTDARREGRKIDCPICRKTTAVPRWSSVPGSRSSEAGEKVRLFAPRPPVNTQAAVLSPEEIDFLRGGSPGNPEAAA